MTDSDDVRLLIEDLRGGVPEKCDFCGEPKAADNLEPEEGGAWVCWDCLDRWEKRDDR